MQLSLFMEGLYQSTAFNFLLEPFIYIAKHLNRALILKRRQARNMLDASVVGVGIITGGIILPIYSDSFREFLDGFATTLDVPETLLKPFYFYSGSWIIGYPTSFVSNVMIRSIYASDCCMGDADFYLKASRLKQLAMISEYSEKVWLDVFISLRKKLRSLTYSERGERNIDIEETLNTLMYAPIIEAIDVFEVEVRNYRIQRWKRNLTEDLFELAKMEYLAEMYESHAPEVAEVLQYSVKQIQNSNEVPGNRAEDYYGIILSLLSGDREGLDVFYAQQKLMLAKRYVLENKIHHNLLQLEKLRRKDPSALDDILQEELPQETRLNDREIYLARSVLNRFKAYRERQDLKVSDKISTLRLEIAREEKILDKLPQSIHLLNNVV